MRSIKAEGGWAVVCTEETEIHPTSDISPIIEARLWNEDDIPVYTRMNELVHFHGALAGIQLTHTGHRDPCLYSREVPMSVSALPIAVGYPIQARAMDKADIRDYRRWHRNAALRAKRAGFDIIYVYSRAGASMTGFFFLFGSTNVTTSMAVAWKTAPACCARCWKTPRKRSATPAPWPFATQSTIRWDPTELTIRRKPATLSKCWPTSPTCGTST